MNKPRLAAWILLCGICMLQPAFAHFPESRDPLKWTFSSQSIWNMPIGHGEKHVIVDLEPVSNGMTADEDLSLNTGIDLAAGAEGLRTYPNPLSEGPLQVEIPDQGFAGGQLCVYDISGRILQELVIQNRYTQMDLTRHGKEMYLLRLVYSQESFEKIIIVN